MSKNRWQKAEITFGFQKEFSRISSRITRYTNTCVYILNVVCCVGSRRDTNPRNLYKKLVCTADTDSKVERFKR